ncbi:uncharacterized protein LOC117060544 isoform X1 [Lacerta agilis]|uniref:uncharacterized protein LOC117060544 isoform X1 n=1 Tax=Lacerta agilis TaxID=80427 RepID=UPI00141986FE|nr:uncharacterized protein LOC117060544 isoform X1 [Lacerta agilis]
MHVRVRSPARPFLPSPGAEQHGPPAALLEPPEEPRVLQPPRPDPKVRAQHVPPVLPPVRQGHRLHQAGLNICPPAEMA